MVCVLIVIAISMCILKGVQLAISIAHPLPNESDLHWRQNPRLPAGGQAGLAPKVKQKQKQPSRTPRGKRPPRDIRIEQLYSSSPLSFEELDSSFGRRSGASGGGGGGGGGGNSGHYGSRARTPQSSSRYEVELLNSSGGQVGVGGGGGGGGGGHEAMQMRPGIALEHLSFVEDDLDDPIEAYVQQQHQRILREHQNRASTPIQSPPPPPPHNSSSSSTRQYSSKSHATIV